MRLLLFCKYVSRMQATTYMCICRMGFAFGIVRVLCLRRRWYVYAYSTLYKSRNDRGCIVTTASICRPSGKDATLPGTVIDPAILLFICRTLHVQQPSNDRPCIKSVIYVRRS